MESAALRASHRLGPGQKGVLVRSVAPTSPAAGTLRAGDIIMRFDGMQVACDGTVPFRRAPSRLCWCEHFDSSLVACDGSAAASRA